MPLTLQKQWLQTQKIIILLCTSLVLSNIFIHTWTLNLYQLVGWCQCLWHLWALQFPQGTSERLSIFPEKYGKEIKNSGINIQKRRIYPLLSFYSFSAILSQFIKKQSDAIHEHKTVFYKNKIVLHKIIAIIFVYMIWVEHYIKAESQEKYYPLTINFKSSRCSQNNITRFSLFQIMYGNEAFPLTIV